MNNEHQPDTDGALKQYVHQLTSLNLMSVGRPMGSPIAINFIKLFRDAADARAFAEKDHGKAIEWNHAEGSSCSPDLGYVQYRIVSVEVF